MLLSDDDCDAFVGAHASEDERAAYGLLRTGAQRADLFRLLFLKAIGGVYADLDLELRGTGKGTKRETVAGWRGVRGQSVATTAGGAPDRRNSGRLASQTCRWRCASSRTAWPRRP